MPNWPCTVCVGREGWRGEKGVECRVGMGGHVWVCPGRTRRARWGARGGAGLPVQTARCCLPCLCFPFSFFPLFFDYFPFFDFPFYFYFPFFDFVFPKQTRQEGGRTMLGATAARGTARAVGGHGVVFLRGKKMAATETRVIRKKKQGLHKVPATIERVSTQIQQRHLLNESARLKRLLGRGTNLK